MLLNLEIELVRTIRPSSAPTRLPGEARHEYSAEHHHNPVPHALLLNHHPERVAVRRVNPPTGPGLLTDASCLEALSTHMAAQSVRLLVPRLHARGWSNRHGSSRRVARSRGSGIAIHAPAVYGDALTINVHFTGCQLVSCRTASYEAALACGRAASIDPGAFAQIIYNIPSQVTVQLATARITMYETALDTEFAARAIDIGYTPERSLNDL